MAENIFTEALTHNMDWGDVYEDGSTQASGKAVQDYIKGPLIDSRVGYIFNVSSGNINYLYGFAKKDDFDRWNQITTGGTENLDNVEAKKYVLTSCAQPKAEPQPYYTTVLKSMESTKDIVSINGVVNLKIQFQAIDYQHNSDRSELVPELQQVTGTLKCQVRNQDGTWSNLNMDGVQTNIESSVKDGDYATINITNAITKEESLIRLFVESRTASGELVTTNYIQFNIIKTIVTISNATAWSNPIDISNLFNPKIKLQYYVGGAVDKVLVVKVSGHKDQFDVEGRVERLPLGKTAYISNACSIELKDSDNPDEYKVCKNGIHDIESYVEIYVNGVYNGETEHIYSQIYVKSDSVDDNVYAVVNNLNLTPTNWTSYADKPMFDYVILGGAGSTAAGEVGVNIKFIDIDTRESYLSIENVIQKNTIQHFTNSLEIDHNDSEIGAELVISIDAGEGDELELFRKTIIIDNTGGFAPTRDSDFTFNPKKYDNSSFGGIKINSDNVGYIINESNKNNPNVNAVYNNFEFNSDAFVYNKETKSQCFSVLSGQELDIQYKPFENCGTQCVIEFTYMVKNVVDENVPIFSISQDDPELKDEQGNVISNPNKDFTGFKLYPYKALMYTTNQRDEMSQDLWLAPNQIVNLAILANINNPTNSIDDDSTLVYLYINGVANRVFKLSNVDLDEFGKGINQGGKFKDFNIKIGNSAIGSDIDIYNLRVYKSQSLKHADILQNYISNALTIEEKQRIKKSNSVIDENRQLIDIGLCEQHGYNTLTWKPCSDPRSAFYNSATYAVGKHRGSDKGTRMPGDLVIKFYKKDSLGNPILDTKRSGTITNLWSSGQGTSSRNYWKWNLRWEFDCVKIDDAYAKYAQDENSMDYNDYVDAEDDDGGEYTALVTRFWPLESFPDGPVYPPSDRTNLTEQDIEDYKNEIAKTKEAYQLADGDPWAKRLDAKINWASPMQSHKLGSVNLYHDVWKRVIGRSDITNYEDSQNRGKGFTGTSLGYKSCRVAIRQEPFLLFEQEEATGNPEFYALFTMGPSKGDKPTFGYNKKDFPDYIMMEGTDNSRNLVNCRVPWNNIDITFGDEVYMDKGDKTWEVGMGNKKAKTCSLVEKSVNPVVVMFKNMINFCYECRVNIEAYNGTYTEFKTAYDDLTSRPGMKDYTSSGEEVSTRKMYWMNKADDSGAKYNLYRYDPRSKQWVNAGIEYESETVINETTQYVNYEPYNLLEKLHDSTLKSKIESAGTTLKTKNLYFQRDRIKKYRGERASDQVMSGAGSVIYGATGGINDYVHKEDLMYTLQLLKLIAASDNWAKNTYIYNPGIYEEDSNGDIVRTHADSGQLVKVNEEVKQFGAARFVTDDERGEDSIQKYKLVSKFGFFQDDLDTIFSLDNKGNKIKPYYVDENDLKDASQTHWNAEENPLFKNAYYAWDDQMCEICEKSVENRYMTVMMNAILTQMANIYDEIKPTLDKDLALPEESDKVLACWDAYYGRVTKYIPAVAYNEIMRLLYVRSTTDSDYMANKTADPIAQAVGDQYVGEKEWFRRRSILLSSYAEAGEFESKDAMGSSGMMSFRSAKLPNNQNPSYKYKAKPVQYLWFTVADGQSTQYPTQIRRYSPDEYAELDWTPGQDATQMIRGINYVSEINDLGGFRSATNEALTITGNRITNFFATPAGTRDIYGNADTNPYRNNVIFGATKGISVINMPVLKSINITGTPFADSAIKGSLDLNEELAKLYKLEKLNIPGSRITALTLPNPNNLTELIIPSTVATLILKGSNKLTSNNISVIDETDASVGFKNITSLDISNCKGFDTKDFVQTILNGDNKLDTLLIGKVDWTGENRIDMEFLQKLMRFNKANLSISGKIDLTGSVGFDLKMNMLDRFGNIDDVNNSLYINYNRVQGNTNANVHSISGPGSIWVVGKYKLSVNYTGRDGMEANDFNSVNWYTDYDNSNNILIDVSTGELNVKNIPDDVQNLKVTCIINRIDGGSITIRKTIQLTQPVGKIGDYVYSDGSYGPPAEDAGDKNIIGVCIYAENVSAGDAKNQLRIAAATEIIKCGATKQDDLKKCAYYPIWGRSSVNLYATPQDQSPETINVYTDFVNKSYLDSTIIKNTSWPDCTLMYPTPSSNTYWGRGYDSELDNAWYTLPHIIMNKHKSVYDSQWKSPFMDFGVGKHIDLSTDVVTNLFGSADVSKWCAGKFNTEYLVKNRSQNKKGTINYEDLTKYLTPTYTDYVGASSQFEYFNYIIIGGNTYQSLTDSGLISSGDLTNRSHYMSNYNPAATYCHIYKPFEFANKDNKHSNGSVLHSNFREGNWFLPSMAELSRMLYFAYTTVDAFSGFGDETNSMAADGYADSFKKLGNLLNGINSGATSYGTPLFWSSTSSSSDFSSSNILNSYAFCAGISTYGDLRMYAETIGANGNNNYGLKSNQFHLWPCVQF